MIETTHIIVIVVLMLVAGAGFYLYTGKEETVQLGDIIKTPDSIQPNPEDKILDGRLGNIYTEPNFKGRIIPYRGGWNQIAKYNFNCTTGDLSCWQTTDHLTGSMWLFNPNQDLAIITQGSKSPNTNYFSRLKGGLIPNTRDLAKLFALNTANRDGDIGGTLSLTTDSQVRNDHRSAAIWLTPLNR